MTSPSNAQEPTPPTPKLPERPHYLTPREVAALLRTSEDVVRGLCLDGSLRAFRVRKRWRIHADSLAHLIG